MADEQLGAAANYPDEGGDGLGTHVIIDARTRRVHASLEAPGDGTIIFAVDLIGDTWEDFSYFTAEARVAERAEELTKRNRCVRAATAALFSHLDGVVSDVLSVLRNDSSFVAYQPKNPDRCSLKNKLIAIHNFLVNHRKLSLTAPALDLKLLRDILNHPTVTKGVSESGSRETIFLDGSDVYGITVEDLETAGREIGR